MSDTILQENSMFSDATKRAAIVADAPLCTSLFFINYLGFLGLYALNDSRGYMKIYEQTEKKLKINEIADDNHDASLVVKLCVEAGVVNDGQVAQVTKLLALIKHRSIRATNLDSTRVRELIEKTMMHNKPMSQFVKPVVTAFMTGAIDLKEFARQIYDVSKTNTFRDYTLEFRTLVIKGQYTDYFTVMKRGGTVAAPAAQSGTTRPPVGAAKPPAVDKVAMAAAEFEKIWRSTKGVHSYFITQWMTSLSASVVADRNDRTELLQASIDKVPAGVFEDFPIIVSSNIMRGVAMEVAYMVSKRQVDLALSKNDWNTTKGVVEVLSSTGSFDNQASAGDEIGKVTIEGIKKHPLPTNDTQWDSWIRLVHLALYTKKGDEMAKLLALVDPKGINHNAHLLTMPVTLGTNVKLIDPGMYGAKAMAWIRKWGPFAGNGNRLVSLRVSTAMTHSVWKAMSINDQAVWMSQNFNPAGVDKASTWMTRDNNPSDMSYTKISPAARAAVIQNIGSAWKDAATLRAIAINNGRDRWLSLAAVVVADIMIREQRGVPEAAVEIRKRLASSMFIVNRYGSVTDKTAWPQKEITDLVKGIDISDAVGVQKLISIASDLSSTGFFAISADFKKPIGMKDIVEAVYASSSRVSGIDVSGTYVHFDSDAITAEAADWVRKFGSMFDRPVSVRAAPIDDPDVAAEYCVLHATTDEVERTPVEFDEAAIREIYTWSRDKWTSVVVRLVASGKHDSMFTTSNIQRYGSSIRGLGTHFVDFDNMIPALRAFVMDNYEYEDLKRFTSTWLDMTYMKVPVKEGALKWAAKTLSDRMANYGYNDSDEAMALAIDVIDRGLMNSSNAIFVTSIVSFVAGRGVANKAKIAVMAEKLMKAGDEYKGFLAGVLGPDLMYQPELFPAIRWAFPLTTDEVVEALKATRTGGTYGAYRSLTFDPKFAPGVPNEWRTAYNSGRGYNDKNVPVAAWAAEIPEDILAPAFDEISQHDFLSMARSNANVPAVMEVFKKTFLKELDAPLVPWAKDVSGGKTSRALEAMKILGIDDEDVKKKFVKGSLGAMLGAQGCTPSDFATFVDEVDTALISTEHISALVKKFTSTDSKGAIAALAALAYDDDKKTVNADFIAAVRAANSERAVISRLSKTLEVVSALDIINADPNGVPIQMDKAPLDKFLKFNNVDMSKSVKVSVSRLEDFGTAKAKVNAVVPPLAMTELKDADVLKDRIRALHKANRYNHRPALGLEVKRTFGVNIPGQKDRFDAWCKANPTTKIMTLYHGTGTINAAFILRFGFKIIASTDPSVTGRMLGDGIYFADNINKTMLYMSNAGYTRQDDQEGYVLKCLVALGKTPKDYKEGGASKRSLVSNEWAIFSTDQILIQEAYYGISREKKYITTMLGESAMSSRYNTSTFMFMDGMVPIDKTILVDFEKLPDFGNHVSVETSAKGPIVTIRHDTTVKPMHRCYRWGEEMMSLEKARDLTAFLKLLRNTY